MPVTVSIRAAVTSDLESLWHFLAMAAYEPHAAAAKAIPMVASYLDDWPRPDDFGFIAEQNATPIGGVWARQFSADDPWHFHFGDRMPELSIGVEAAARGQGVGQMLIHALIAEASRRGVGLCLNVRLINPARSLYERMGFRDVPDTIVTNRVGGQSVAMVRSTPARP